ncbi:MAG: hypothetical protein OXI41_01780 [Chloroflexota bacterium]|nr:hypothetical protein [Chloroflexota bacterium]MDE2894192.1 hypothetical protein [Chloroflexota bacterium]
MTDALVLQEGFRYGPTGAVIRTAFLDFRKPAARAPVHNLVKVCESEFALESCGSIQISKPEAYRDEGETLQSDPEEARPSRVEALEESIDDPQELAEASLRDAEANRAAKLVGASIRRQTTSVTTRRTRTSSLESGRSGWIYSTAMEPSDAPEERSLLDALPAENDHYSFIRNRSGFAFELALVIAAHNGPRGRSVTVSDKHGDRQLTAERPSQIVFHGPVIYLPEPYEFVFEYQAGHSERGIDDLLVPLFVKRERYTGQREYRFVVWSEAEPEQLRLILPTSPGMLAAMQDEVGQSRGCAIPLY